MPDLPVPSAPRLPRARWLDVRLLAGVLLVLVSVVAGARVVAAADDTVPVWTLRHPVAPGSIITGDDLVARQVRLGEGLAAYFAVEDGTPSGLAAGRALAAGELVPKGAVAPHRSLDIRRVALGVDQFAAAALERGSVVDVYHVPGAGADTPSPAGDEASGPGAAPQGKAGQPTGTRLLMGSVSVDSVEAAGKGLGAAAGRGMVVLLLLRDQVPAFLDAQSKGRVELVEVASSRRERP